MPKTTTGQKRAAAGRGSTIARRVEALERQLALLSLTDRLRQLSTRVARLEEERGTS